MKSKIQHYFALQICGLSKEEEGKQGEYGLFPKADHPQQTPKGTNFKAFSYLFPPLLLGSKYCKGPCLFVSFSLGSL